MFAVVHVRFVNDDIKGVLSRRVYPYIVEEEDFQYILDDNTPTMTSDGKDLIPTYKIFNYNNNSTYQDASVVIVGGEIFHDSEQKYFDDCKVVKLEGSGFDLMVDSLKMDIGFGAIRAFDNCMREYWCKNNIEEQKESSDNMFNNVMKDIEFGVAKDVKFSLYGPAFKSAEGRYIALAADGQSYDVTGLTLDDLDKMNYMFPTSATEIAAGDFIRHNKEWVKVVKVNEDQSLNVLKMSSNEEVVVRPVKNVFGFNYYTKLMTLCGQLTGTPDEKNPFGNLLPLMLLSDGDSSMSKIIPFMMMSQGGEFKMDMNNPLLLMAMMK